MIKLSCKKILVEKPLTTLALIVHANFHQINLRSRHQLRKYFDTENFQIYCTSFSILSTFSHQPGFFKATPFTKGSTYSHPSQYHSVLCMHPNCHVTTMCVCICYFAGISQQQTRANSLQKRSYLPNMHISAICSKLNFHLGPTTHVVGSPHLYVCSQTVYVLASPYIVRVLSRNFGLGWKGTWHFHARSPPPNHQVLDTVQEVSVWFIRLKDSIIQNPEPSEGSMRALRSSRSHRNRLNSV